MQQVAVFVDAGYLFAASSALLTGSKQPRTDVKLHAEQAIKELIEAAAKAAPYGQRSAVKIKVLKAQNGINSANMAM